MTKSRSDNEASSFEALDDALLAEVGGADLGLYGTVGWQVGGRGVSYTAAFPSWNPSTWSFYRNEMTGASNGASVYAGAGGFYSNGDASNYFGGPGQSFSLGVNELSYGSVDVGWNDYGASFGGSLGIGASFGGIGVAAQETYGTQLDSDALFNSPDMSGDSAAPYFAA